jgi:hypothetical protein
MSSPSWCLGSGLNLSAWEGVLFPILMEVQYELREGLGRGTEQSVCIP